MSAAPQRAQQARAVQSEGTTCAELLSRRDARGIRKICRLVLGLFHTCGQPLDCVPIKITRLLHLPQGYLSWISTSLAESALRA